LFAEKPNNATAYTSDQILAVAKQVERAQALGSLSEEKGDEYLTLLIRANDLLDTANNTFNDIELCAGSATKFQCIDSILATVEAEIQNE
jgi:hypothetical protein